MAKLQLRTNVPEIIALQFAQGKEVESNFNGTEILYTLEDGRSWYVHPAVARKIDALSLGKGEPFEVTKTAAGTGKGFTYEVKHLHQAAPQASFPSQAAVPPSVQTRQNGTTSAHVVHTASQDSAPSPVTQRMMSSFTVAIDAIAEAQAYANRKGLGLTFTSENLTSAALSVFINACKEGR